MFRCFCFPKSVKTIRRLLTSPKKLSFIELEEFVNGPIERTIVSETIDSIQTDVEFYSTPVCFLLDKPMGRDSPPHAHFILKEGFWEEIIRTRASYSR